MQAKLADMYVGLSASRCYLYSTARAFSNGYANNKDCSGVFLFTAENCVKIALEAIQCLGKAFIVSSIGLL